MRSRHSLLVALAWFAAACGDGGHHLPDAPPGTTDAAIDAPGDSGPGEVALHVGGTGTGSGTITSSPDGIACGSTCGAEFARGTVVTLTAEPAVGSVFAGWSGACMGAPHPMCEITLDAATNVTATFTLASYTVMVTKAGAGTGTVAGGGLSCGATCTITVAHGTPLNLAATPAMLSTFAGWGGACTGMGTCVLTITGPTAITANFALDDVTLFVAHGGNGAGTVTSNPAGINCGTTCQKTYSAGQMTTLTAVPMAGSTFTGWSGGGCTGTAPCTLTMTAATTVTATFTLQAFPLTVNQNGSTGVGTVTGPGINCGNACSTTVPSGTMITLTATPSAAQASLSTFTGWSGGGCMGTGACTVTVASATTVTAIFTLSPNVMFVTSTLQNGNLGGLAGADSICKARAQAVGLGGSYVAYLSSLNINTPINAPSRVGSATGWVRTDGKPVANDIAQFAAGTLFNPPSFTETKVDVSTATNTVVWTGTSNQGTYANACSGAAASIPWAGTFGSANVGVATSTAANVVDSDIAPCGGTARLYCLGTDRKAIAQ